jgi:hypothetical protein
VTSEVLRVTSLASKLASEVLKVTSDGSQAASGGSRVTYGASREASFEAMRDFRGPKSDFRAIDARICKWLMCHQMDTEYATEWGHIARCPAVSLFYVPKGLRRCVDS